MIPADAWPNGDRREWSDDETRLHYDFTEEPWATTPYTDEENDAADVREAEALAEANRDTLIEMARSALATDRAFQALASPTAAQTAAHVKALNRQIIGLIRLTIGDLTGTD